MPMPLNPLHGDACANVAHSSPMLRVPGPRPTSLPLAPLAFDLGFNNGDDTALLLLQGFRVVAVEADPQLVAAGRRRFAQEERAQEDVRERDG